jgi:hypothetical protein
VPTMPPPRILPSRSDMAARFGAVVKQRLGHAFVSSIGNGAVIPKKYTVEK